MASSRFSSLRRPLVAAAAATAVGGVVAYRAFGGGTSHIVEKPLVELKRDTTGRIVAPTFPGVKSRADQLADLKRSGSSAPDAEYDLLIIGGGATGTGIALDAVTRGLKVALVERDDFAAGTSSKSTKLVHGGVRYLEKAVMNLDLPQLELVIEALHERKTFLTIAPHLSNSLPILLPLQRWWEAPYFWAGTKAYDFLAGSQGLETSYYMSKSKALAAFPMLRRNPLVGALVYYDGQHNDARMNFSIALTAALYGATMLNHVEVTGLNKDSNGKICGATVRDTLASLNRDAEGAREFKVRAKGVINATGPFTDAVERMDDPSRPNLVAPASGVHVMLPGNVCPNGMGLLEASSDGRVIFVLPWQGYTVAGTTDTACEIEQHPTPQQDETDFVLKEVNKLLTAEAQLNRNDVLASWSGIRPLVKDPRAKNTESLVRSHLVTVSPSGLLTCAGGKWTTYRQMAQDAVDEAIKTFNLTTRPATLPDISGAGVPFKTTGNCITSKVPLAGAHGFSIHLPSQLQELYPVDADTAHHLAYNYGDRAWEVLADKSPSATTRLLPNFPLIEAEVRHCARAESACTAADLISRRTRVAFLDVHSAVRALPRVIDLMAEELKWTEARKSLEWTETLKYFRSMGISEDKLSLTREEVMREWSQPQEPKRKLHAGTSKGIDEVMSNPALLDKSS